MSIYCLLPVRFKLSGHGLIYRAGIRLANEALNPFGCMMHLFKTELHNKFRSNHARISEICQPFYPLVQYCLNMNNIYS